MVFLQHDVNITGWCMLYTLPSHSIYSTTSENRWVRYIHNAATGRRFYTAGVRECRGTRTGRQSKAQAIGRYNSAQRQLDEANSIASIEIC